MKDTLVVIPARGGSKGVPDKNIRMMAGKPLIYYSIDSAREFFPDEQICITTDSERIRDCVALQGLKVPFLRPPELATDTAGSYEVLLHALRHYEKEGRIYSKVLLLQPTSPFRHSRHFTEIFSVWNERLDMVVSVGKSHHNPYFSLFEENEAGYLKPCKEGNFHRRQDAPDVYYYNGSMYLINTNSLKKMSLSKFTKVTKYVMEEKYSLDIDTPTDWLICECLQEKGIYKDANS